MWVRQGGWTWGYIHTVCSHIHNFLTTHTHTHRKLIAHTKHPLKICGVLGKITRYRNNWLHRIVAASNLSTVKPCHYSQHNHSVHNHQQIREWIKNFQMRSLKPGQRISPGPADRVNTAELCPRQLMCKFIPLYIFSNLVSSQKLEFSIYSKFY